MFVIVECIQCTRYCKIVIGDQLRVIVCLASWELRGFRVPSSTLTNSHESCYKQIVYIYIYIYMWVESWCYGRPSRIPSDCLTKRYSGEPRGSAPTTHTSSLLELTNKIYQQTDHFLRK